MVLNQLPSQRQSQEHVMTQALRQSLEILSLSGQEMVERIQKELLDNPVLEEKAGLAESQEEQGGLDRTEKKHNLIQNMILVKKSLGEHLLFQLRLLPSLKEKEQKMGEVIISALDERGFLCRTLEELLPYTPQKQAEKVLSIIQALDPIACGAINMAEALLLQAQHMKPEDKITQHVLKNHFKEFQSLQFEKIQKNLAITWEELQKSFLFIRTLAPYPGRLYSNQDSQYLIPDVVVHHVEGELRLFMGDDRITPLQIIGNYEDMWKNARSQKSEKEYLKKKYDAAQFFIKSLQRRQETLYRVTQFIVEYQKDFFLKGPQYLQPLVLHTVAKKLEIHASTVSRATTSKYIQTKWGFFELKYFFSAKQLEAKELDNRMVSNRNVQQRLQEILKKENMTSPLSDQKITEIFQKEGTHIARRTVSKYRKIMDIPSAKQRRRVILLQEKIKK